MDIAAYIDGIWTLLIQAGATEQELRAINATKTLQHCFLQGVSFENAAKKLCGTLGIQIAA